MTLSIVLLLVFVWLVAMVMIVVERRAMGGVDVAGNPWGVDLHADEICCDQSSVATTASFGDHDDWALGGSGGFDDNFGNSGCGAIDHSDPFNSGFD